MTTLIDRIMKSIISLDTSSDQDDKIRQILEAELTAVKDSQPKEVEKTVKAWRCNCESCSDII